MNNLSSSNNLMHYDIISESEIFSTTETSKPEIIKLMISYLVKRMQHYSLIIL